MSAGPKPNCPWRKPPRHPLDRAEKIAHVIGGMMFGALASGGLVISAFFVVAIHGKSLWVPGGIVLGSSAVGGLLAAAFGRTFIDWMDEHCTYSGGATGSKRRPKFIPQKLNEGILTTASAVAPIPEASPQRVRVSIPGQPEAAAGCGRRRSGQE